MTKIAICKTAEEKEILVNFLRAAIFPEIFSRYQRKNLCRKAKQFRLVSDDLYYLEADNNLLKVVFPFETEKVANILKNEHEVAHIGMKKMVVLINQKYFGISKEQVCDFVRSCESCSRFNSLRTIQPVYINDITRKYDRYMMDCVDLRRYADQNDGFGWILNVIDTYTKYLWSFKLQNKTAIAVKESLEYIFNNFGVPCSIQSDNGKEFKNKLLEDFLEELNIAIIHGRPRNPKAQGQVERVNQTIKRWLAKKLYIARNRRWVDHHVSVVKAYNITAHRATSKSPFQLFHGQLGFNRMISSNIVSENELQNTDSSDSSSYKA